MPNDPYAHMAPIYDLVTSTFLDPARRAICRVARVHGLRRAVDACCGTGRQAWMLAGMGVDVVGVDLSPSMLARAAGRPRDIPAAGGNGPRFVQADAACLDEPGGAFDLALTALSLHEMPHGEARRIFLEMWRLVRPGGVVAVADYVPAGAPLARLATWGVVLAERFAGREHYRHYREFMTHGGLPGFLADFRDVTHQSPRLGDTFLLGNAALALMVRT